LSARPLVLDGELAIYDQELRSRFNWLREPDPDAIATPPMFMAFDLLHQDGRELTGRPLRDRRARLESVVGGGELVLPFSERLRGVVGGDRARLRGPGSQGGSGPLRVGTNTPLAEGEAEGLDRRRGPLAAAD
jgi:hypothetical protein